MRLERELPEDFTPLDKFYVAVFSIAGFLLALFLLFIVCVFIAVFLEDLVESYCSNTCETCLNACESLTL